MTVFIIWTIFSGILGPNIGPIHQQELWLPEDHRIIQSINSLRNNFPQGRGDELMLMTLYWGVKRLDRSSISMWDPDSLGEIEFDSAFDLSYPDAQQLFLDWCSLLNSKNYLL